MTRLLTQCASYVYGTGRIRNTHYVQKRIDGKYPVLVGLANIFGRALIYYDSPEIERFTLESIARQALSQFGGVSLSRVKDSGGDLGLAALFVAMVIVGARGNKGIRQQLALQAALDEKPDDGKAVFTERCNRQIGELALMAQHCVSLGALREKAMTLNASPSRLVRRGIPKTSTLASIITAEVGCILCETESSQS